jgi:hypothetical protein
MIVSVLLGVIAAVCFIAMCLSISVAIRLAERLERAQAELKRFKDRQNSYMDSKPLLWRVKRGKGVQRVSDQSLYAVCFEDSEAGTTYVWSVSGEREESADWMERLEEERFEKLLEKGELDDIEGYEPIYFLEELDPEVVDEGFRRRLAQGEAVPLS